MSNDSDFTPKVNEALFRPSEWDNYPLKRNDKHTNKIVQPDFAPLGNLDSPDKLPDGFAFTSLDVTDDGCCRRICAFLNANFNKKDDVGCRMSSPAVVKEPKFVFDANHVKWVLNVPANLFPRASEVRAECNIAVVLHGQTKDKERIVGLITTRPITYRIDGRVIYTLEACWLCTTAEFRGKRLAVVLMKECFRRAYRWGVSVGMLFTMSKQLPALPLLGPRPIKLLVRKLQPGIQANKSIDLVRFVNMGDVPRMMKIYRQYIVEKGWRLHREYQRREFEHTFLRRDDVMTYVVRTDRGDVKDFVSLYAMKPCSNIASAEDETKPAAFVHFITFVNEKILELFMQNVMFIMSHNGFGSVYIADLGGVGETLKSKLGFTEAGDMGYMYQFNYNTLSIDSTHSVLSPVL
jgi:GNAT superfamily N-acetyltransferase